jgi:hypothetical protein
MPESVHRHDAAAAGKYALLHLFGKRPKKSTMTQADRDLVAFWCVRWAGHWGNKALDWEAKWPVIE